MSTEKQQYLEKKDTDSPHLFNYLREEIPVSDLKDFSSPKRLKSIDFVKGFAIVFIVLAHTSSAWLNPDWLFIHAVVFAFLDILGPSLFIFLSALSVIFSIKKKGKKLPEKVIRNRILSRGISIMAIGILFNIFAVRASQVAVYEFPYSLWGWNILAFIGASQIISYYALKLGKIPRIVIGLMVIFYSPILRDFIFSLDQYSLLFRVLHFIIISPVPHTPIIPWVAICFIATIFGEYLYDANQKDTRDAYIGLFRIFFLWGVSFILWGVLTGFELYTPDTLSIAQYPFLGLYNLANTQGIIPGYKYPGMPEFLIRDTPPNMWYNLGWSLVVISIALYFVDIKESKNYFISMLNYFGKLSLSFFLIHYGMLILYPFEYPIWFYAFVYFGFVGFLGFMIYIWMEYGNGVGTPEWIMIQIARVGQKTGENIKKTTISQTKKIKEKTSHLKPDAHPEN